MRSKQISRQKTLLILVACMFSLINAKELAMSPKKILNTSPQNVTVPEEFKLTLAALPEALAAGVPLQIILTVTNVSTSIKAIAMPDVYYRVHVEITDANGNLIAKDPLADTKHKDELKKLTGSPVIFKSVRSRSLHPNGALVYKKPATFYGIVFPDVGDYTIDATMRVTVIRSTAPYKTEDITLQSNRVQLFSKKPNFSK
jgi:hypothetical protein